MAAAGDADDEHVERNGDAAVHDCRGVGDETAAGDDATARIADDVRDVSYRTDSRSKGSSCWQQYCCYRWCYRCYCLPDRQSYP